MRKDFEWLSATVFLCADAFGGTPTTTGKAIKAKSACSPKSEKRAPSWVCKAPADGSVMTAVGSAGKSRAALRSWSRWPLPMRACSLPGTCAGQAGKQVRAAQMLQAGTRLESDSALTTRIADESLQGTQDHEKARNPDGTLYVLVGIDAKTARKSCTRSHQRRSTGAETQVNGAAPINAPRTALHS